MKEVYKDIKGYEGLYQVSNIGNVRSLPNGRHRGCVLKAYEPKYGYKHVVLTKNGVQKTYKIHRLVAEVFIDNPDCKLMVNHINAIKTDNRVENLEWVTKDENIIHARRMGLYKPENWCNGTYLQSK